MLIPHNCIKRKKDTKLFVVNFFAYEGFMGDILSENQFQKIKKAEGELFGLFFSKFTRIFLNNKIFGLPKKFTLRGQTVHWIGAQFCVCMFLDSRIKLLNMFQNVSGLHLQKFCGFRVQIPVI